MTTASPVNVYRISAYASLAMILFFVIMKLIGLVTVVELRFFNFFIMFLGVRYSILQSQKATKGKSGYLQGMLTGFMTALFTSLFFAVFVAIYLFLDKNFLDYLKATQPFGSYLTPGAAALVTVIEGVAAGAILTFAMMNLFDRDTNTD